MGASATLEDVPPISSVDFVVTAIGLALGLLDGEDEKVFDQNVRNMRFATFIGGGLSTLFPRLLLRKTCCNVVGIRDVKPLGNADDDSAEVLEVELAFNDGNATFGSCRAPFRFAFRISTA